MNDTTDISANYSVIEQSIKVLQDEKSNYNIFPILELGNRRITSAKHSLVSAPVLDERTLTYLALSGTSLEQSNIFLRNHFLGYDR